MSTPDTNNPGIKLQAAGENLNTWGDPNLNNDLIVLSHLASGWLPITISGDYTVSSNETNYSTTNPSEYAALKLVAGTVTAAFNFTLAARAKRFLLWNATGYTATVKLSATTGFTLPTGRIVIVATDGSADAYNFSPNYIGTAVTPTNSGDVANKLYVDTAVATAGLPATAGTVLVSGSDLTAGYVGTKVNVTASGAASVVASIVNPGTNEVKTFAIAVGALGLTLQAMQAVNFTAVAGNLYPVDTSTVTTITLPPAATLGDTIGFIIGGTAAVAISPNGLKINGSTSSLTVDGDQTLVITYWGASRGWL